MKGIAIIDICGTLYDSNTTFDFLRWRSPGKHRFKRWVSTTLAAKAVNKASMVLTGFDLMRAWWVRELSGVTQQELQRSARAFAEEYLPGREITEVHQLIDGWREKGYRLVLVSATLDVLAEAIAARLGVEEVHSSQLVYEDRVCKGTLKKDLLGRKSAVVDPLIRGYGRVAVVTDNTSDWALLALSTEGYIVSDREHLAFWEGKTPGNKYSFIMID